MGVFWYHGGQYALKNCTEDIKDVASEPDNEEGQ